MTSLTHEPSTAATVDVERGAASWRALGTYVELRTTPEAVEAAADLAARVLDEVDVACSRFRDDSDLMRANRAAGHAVEVSPVLVGAVRVALEAADETDGLVDPLLGDVLRAAGYDRTFSLVPADDPTATALPVPEAALGAGRGHRHHRDRAPWRGPRPRRDRQGLRRRPRRPLRRRHLRRTRAGLASGATSASPHRATTLQDQPVVVGHSLADLEAGGASTLVRLGAGGLATSSVSARRWRRGGRQWHHVVDPRTGLPAQGPWRTVTALGRTAAAANAATTASIVLGDAAYGWLVDRQVAARLVDHDGHVTRTPAWTASGIEEIS